jgi:hypothetical protein
MREQTVEGNPTLAAATGCKKVTRWREVTCEAEYQENTIAAANNRGEGGKKWMDGHGRSQ